MSRMRFMKSMVAIFYRYCFLFRIYRRQRPNQHRNFCGRTCLGNWTKIGAWERVIRYSYQDLKDQAVDGGFQI